MAVLAVLAASPRGQLALHTSGSSGTTLEATRCAATPPRSTASGCHHTLTTTHFVLAFALCLGGLVRLALSRIADCCARRRLGQRRALLGRRPCASQTAENGRAEPPRSVPTRRRLCRWLGQGNTNVSITHTRANIRAASGWLRASSPALDWGNVLKHGPKLTTCVRCFRLPDVDARLYINPACRIQCSVESLTPCSSRHSLAISKTIIAFVSFVVHNLRPNNPQPATTANPTRQHPT